MPGTNSSHTPRGAQRAHRHQAAVPAVEVADDPDAARVRRPDREAHAGDALVRARMRAEHVVQPLVRPLADEVQVDLAERRAEPIRVVELPGVAVGEAEADPVVGTARAARSGTSPAHRPSPGGLHRRACRRSARRARRRWRRDGRRGRPCPSGAGCAPRIACGSWCSPRARRRRSSVAGRRGSTAPEVIGQR